MAAVASSRTEPSAWLRWLSLAALVGVWQLASLWADPADLPAPARVMGVLAAEIASGELPYHLAVTLLRVAVAFALAMLLGSIFGMLMGRYRSLDLLGDGPLVLGLNVPALIIIMLCYLWLGLTELAAVLAVVVNKIPTVAVTVREGARAVDQDLLDVARAYRLGAWRRLWRVYLPQLQPYLLAAARSGLSLIWKIVLVVELLGRSSGVGFKLGTFFQFFDIASILAYTLAFAAVVFAVEAWLMRPLERHLARWRR